MAEEKSPTQWMREAIVRKDLKSVKNLIDNGLSINQNLGDPSGDFCSPLLFSIFKKQKSIAKWLIENGAELNERSASYHHYPIICAARLELADIVLGLIDAGADIHVADDNGWTALDHVSVCDAPGVGALVKSLVKAGADVQRCSKTWGTPLIKACHAANVQAVAALIEAGAEVNAITPKATPLLMAICRDPRGLVKKPDNKSLEVVAALFAAGADPNLPYNWTNAGDNNEVFVGKTPLEYARELKQKKWFYCWKIRRTPPVLLVVKKWKQLTFLPFGKSWKAL